jgi:predicted  nucleic acid-binding Zn-ribbon protein
VPDTPGASGVPGDVAALRAENARLRDTVERQRMLLEDKDAKIAGLEAGNAELEERVARLERLISRNSGFSEQIQVELQVRVLSQVTVDAYTLAGLLRLT